MIILSEGSADHILYQGRRAGAAWMPSAGLTQSERRPGREAKSSYDTEPMSSNIFSHSV